MPLITSAKNFVAGLHTVLENVKKIKIYKIIGQKQIQKF